MSGSTRILDSNPIHLAELDLETCVLFKWRMEPKSHAADPITQFPLDTGHKFDGFHERTIWTTRALVEDSRKESDVPFSGSVGDQLRGDITPACRLGAS